MLLSCRILCCFTVFGAILKRFPRVSALQNGLKHRETTKHTTGEQDESILFTEHQILRI